MELTFYSLLYIIWGIALGLLFKRGCKERNCIIFRAPDRKKVESTVYKYKDKCYSFSHVDTKCDRNPIKE